MKSKSVKDILLPLKESIPLHPAVGPQDRITYAIELMANNNLSHIAVVINQRPIGMIQIEDAFRELGLHSRRWKTDLSL